MACKPPFVVEIRHNEVEFFSRFVQCGGSTLAELGPQISFQMATKHNNKLEYNYSFNVDILT